MQHYQHSRHAGNFADVIKHVIVVEISSFLCQQQKPLVYIDTHAGAGLYQLTSEPPVEYANGVSRLFANQPDELQQYLAVLEHYNPAGQLALYPGSPLVAMSLLRPGDTSYLFECNTEVYKALRENVTNKHKVVLHNEDGYAGLLNLLPSNTKNCFVLIDPAYKDAADYVRVLQALRYAYGKQPDGVYAIWYPVIRRTQVLELENTIMSLGLKSIQQYELNVAADSNERMTGAGMLVVNPPSTLMVRMQTILPILTEMLARGEGANYRCVDR